jgi:hypothetical protein
MKSTEQTDRTKTFEKLGAFYLGRKFDDARGAITPELVLYDAKDLTTHAVCVGMTGSGKTGLCVSLLEEAAIDGIPAIVIDPKGDMGNLLLNFPELRAADFGPWVDQGEAARKGMSSDEYASAVAEKWKHGLAEWDQDGARVKRLRDSAEFAIYTPGSSAGIPLNILGSFAAPNASVMDDVDVLRERVSATVSGLLALVGIDADPVRSREHILLANLFERGWSEGRQLDIASLIAEVQSPPIEKVGVLDLETFYPHKDRFELAMRLNNLLASPGFAGWMEGEPLEIPRLLWTQDGRPRISILSIAHLSDSERMFFVTILLNEVISWMRSQAGTPSLRALLYMDEVFGYFPPTANPPSKTPMLTLLKQARAYGLGVVLATQNPVDLDYKGLSNAGTWFLGRLQTERDKARVMDGLEGVSAASGASFDRQKLEATLSGMKSRVFFMHNVHEQEPVLFHTRWAMSYLRGPLTRSQIQTLMSERKENTVRAVAQAPSHFVATSKPRRANSERPALPPEIRDEFVPAKAGTNRILYQPSLLATADLHFADARSGIDVWDSVSYLAPLKGRIGAKLWESAEVVKGGEVPTVDSPEDGAEFAVLPKAATQASSYKTWQKVFKTHLYQYQTLELLKCKALKLSADLGETEAEFSVRVRETVREKRDVAVEKLRKRYAPKVASIHERIRKAEDKIGREKAQYDQQKMQTAISMGATVLGALFGRKVASVGTVGRATTAVRGVGRSAREKGDIERAKRDLEALNQKLVDLDAELEQEAAALAEAFQPDAYEVTAKTIRTRKTDTNIGHFGLVWLPHQVSADGTIEPAY